MERGPVAADRFAGPGLILFRFQQCAQLRTVSVEVGKTPLLGHPSALQHNDVIEVSGESGPVQRPDDTPALHFAQNGIQHPALGRAVQIADAFVDDEEVGPLDQGAAMLTCCRCPADSRAPATPTG